MTIDAAAPASNAAAPEAAPPPSPPPAAAPAERSGRPVRRVRGSELESIMADLGVSPDAEVSLGEADDDAAGAPPDPPASGAAPPAGAPPAEAPAAAPQEPAAGPDGLSTDPEAARRQVAEAWVQAQRTLRKAREREQRSLELARRAEQFEAARARALEDPTAALQLLGVEPVALQSALIDQRLQTPPEPPNPLAEEAKKLLAPYLERFDRELAERQQAAQQQVHQRDVGRAAAIAKDRIAPLITADSAEALLVQFGGNATQAAMFVTQELVNYHQAYGVVLSPEQAIKALDQHFEKQHADTLERLRAARRYAPRFAPAAAAPPAARPAAAAASPLNTTIPGPTPAAPPKQPRRGRMSRAQELDDVLSELEAAGIRRDARIE